MSAAFQHIVTLLSFVLAVSVSHQLLTVVEIVRAGPRARMSFVHALGMANGFIAVVGWWFGIWEIHAVEEWPVLSVLLNLAGVVCVSWQSLSSAREFPKAALSISGNSIACIAGNTPLSRWVET